MGKRKNFSVSTSRHAYQLASEKVRNSPQYRNRSHYIESLIVEDAKRA